MTNNMPLRLLSGPNPQRCGGRRAGRAFRGLENRRDQAVHPLHRPISSIFRLHDLLRHALSVQVLGSIPRPALSDRLVR